MGRRVVVTGIGLLTPVGNNTEANWSNLMAGKSGIGRITKFDPSRLSSQVAGELKNFDPTVAMEPKEVRRYDPFVHMAIAVAQEAVASSGLSLEGEDADRAGIIWGTGIAGLQTILEMDQVNREKGPRRVSPFYIPGLICNIAPGLMAIRWNFGGANYATGSACASSAHALGDAYHMILRGDADVMLTGGSEAVILEVAVAGFASARALSTRECPPEEASCPFSAERDGFVMAEGAAALILEERAHALARGAMIYAEVAGYGASSDRYHITAPEPEGMGAARAMKAALKSGCIDPSEVGYINTHGTSTELGDIAEVKALKHLFGEHAYRLAISSTKSMTGHTLGAAGAIEAAYTALALRRRALPPTINYKTPDPECDLDVVPNQARQADVEVALTNSLGFGGTNTCIALRQYRD
jgi:3-oxoacyl-[acyl-carrier-protein] synthase II